MTQERTHQHFLELIHKHQGIIHKICFVYCREQRRQGRSSTGNHLTGLEVFHIFPGKCCIFLLALVCVLLFLAYFIFR